MTGKLPRFFPALLVAALVGTGSTHAQDAPQVSIAASIKPKDVEWAAMGIDELRQRAHADEVPAMEELGRRLATGKGVPRDQATAVAWFQRAADAGSPAGAFNLGVMYERGIGVEHSDERAVEWYRKAANAGVPPAMHNLALMLREGKGTPQDGPKAAELLRAAARKGMTASMFVLGDLYERGGVVLKDPAAALAWFAIASQMELQANRGTETPLAKAAQHRGEALERVMSGADRERADQIGQAEFKTIVAAVQPRPESPPPAPPPAPPAPAAAAEPTWPAAPADQVRLVQQALIDLKRLKSKADGAAGPATRLAIREFEKSAGLPSTGEPSRTVYIALVKAVGQRDPAIAPVDAPPPPTSADLAKSGTAKPASAETGGWPAKTSDQVRAIQRLLVELKLLNAAPTGTVGPLTHRAIRDFQKKSGLEETGEPSQTLFDQLKSAKAKAGG